MIFKTQAAAAAERVRDGVRAPGVAELFAPGEIEWRRERASDGLVDLDAPVVAMLSRYASELGVMDTPLQQGTREKRHA